MISPNHKSHEVCDSTVSTHRLEQQRMEALYASGLLETDHVSIFDEATQTAAHFLSIPMCILGVMDHDRHWFKSAVGLSRIGLMNALASARQLPRSESFCNQVVERQRPVVIPDTQLDPTTSSSTLVQLYGIRAYLGVPLFDSHGQCLGSLAVMELTPRQFSPKDIAFLELMARWSMSEYERDRLKTQQLKRSSEESKLVAPALAVAPSAVDEAQALHTDVLLIKSDLLTQMTQELRTPLTSVLGMTSVLKREIYGALTTKQHEYIDVVHTSGQYLLSLVNEILEIGSLETDYSSLELSPVDIEMLCQHAIQSLEQTAQRREQTIQLTVEPGHRIWYLDKNKIRQMLYHLIFNLIQTSNPGSVVRVHISRKQQQLHMMIWTSHPWLGDGLPHTPYSSEELIENELQRASQRDTASQTIAAYAASRSKPTETAELEDAGEAKLGPSGSDRHRLGLKLSQRLAALHGGEISIQGSAATGFHYVAVLPQLAPVSSAE